MSYLYKNRGSTEYQCSDKWVLLFSVMLFFFTALKGYEENSLMSSLEEGDTLKAMRLVIPTYASSLSVE